MTPRNENAAAAAAGVPGYSGHLAAIIPGVLFIAERPGGGGRSQRVARRERDLVAVHAAGVRTIVSGLRTRAGLVEYAQAGFGVRWHPLESVAAARDEIPRLVQDVAEAMAREPGAVLIHCDRVSEWDAAIMATALVWFGIAPDYAAGLDAAAAAGFPVDDLARDLVGVPPPA